MISRGSEATQGRIMINEVVQSLNSILQADCPVCLKTMTDVNYPIIICSSQHCLCRACYNKKGLFKLKGRCPQCRDLITYDEEMKPFRLYVELYKYTHDMLKPQAHKVLIHQEQCRLKHENEIRQCHQKLKKLDFLAVENPNKSQQDILLEKNEALMAFFKANQQALLRPVEMKPEQEHFFSFNVQPSVQEAIKSFQRQIENRRDDGKVFLGLGQKYSVKGYLDCLQPYEAFHRITKGVSEVSVYDKLSFWCMYSKDKYSHLKWYQLRLKGFPDSPELLWGSGNIYFNAGHIPQAEKRYRKCQKFLPNNERLKIMLAYCAAELNELGRVRDILADVREESKEYYYLMAFSKKDYSPQLEEKLRTMTKAEPGEAKVWEMLAYVSKFKHQSQEMGQKAALQIMEEGLEHIQQSVLLHCKIALVYSKLHNLQLQLRHQASLVDQSLYFFEGEKKQACFHLINHYKTTNPRLHRHYRRQDSRINEMGLVEYGLISYHRGWLKQAEYYWSQVPLIELKAEGYYHFAGRTQYGLGKFQKAIELFMCSVKEDECWDCYEPWVNSLEKQGQLRQALRVAIAWSRQQPRTRAEEVVHKIKYKLFDYKPGSRARQLDALID